jgi:phosphoribosylamine--glycine ligase
MPAAIQLNAFKTLRCSSSAVSKHRGKAVTTSGRCVTVVGIKENIVSPVQQAGRTREPSIISFPDSWYRQDIGNKFFEN